MKNLVLYTKVLQVKRPVPRFQLYPISYLQNKSGLLSIQPRETNICNKDITYKNIRNTVNIDQTKHKKGYSDSMTGTFTFTQRNEEYCLILSLSNFVYLIKYT